MIQPLKNVVKALGVLWSASDNCPSICEQIWAAKLPEKFMVAMKKAPLTPSWCLLFHFFFP